MSVTTNEGQRGQLLVVTVPRHRNVLRRDREATVGTELKRVADLPSDSTIRLENPEFGTSTSQDEEPVFSRSWNRFLRKGKTNVGFMDSLKATALSSWLNIFLIFVPLAWISHFLRWREGATFARGLLTAYYLALHNTSAVCFLSILPLAKLSEFGGEQLAFYLGKDLGDFFVVSLNKYGLIISFMLC